jgi:hypothetical protein
MADSLVVLSGPASHVAFDLAENHQDPSQVANFLVVRRGLQLIWHATS